ncbi:hypothetical protein V2A60_003838 [Cordyceps javanica]|uniref:ATP synthase F0 n=1 Tax=Cordyceps javanica TaxID=43265 RepID=A0A545UX19_9HYPO|nr:ATP synthase F0 [Cordyceps javanica]TQW01689.1 ATP synthase F0 [Cordyceps javanica]
MTWVSQVTPEVDAISQWRTIVAVCVVLTIVSFAVVGFRLWLSVRGRGLMADDYVAAASFVLAFVYSVLTIIQTKYGLGLPLKLRSHDPGVASTYKKVNFAGRPIYQFGVSLFKVALLISYLRLLQATSKRNYRVLIWVTIVAVLLGHLGSAFALIFACKPVSFSWKLTVSDPNPTCVNLSQTSLIYSLITIISDVLVAVLPIPVLLTLKIPNAKKAGLVGVFLLGLFTTICSVLRLVQLNRISFGDGNSTMLVLWGVIEFNVGNMVTSLPFLAPVFIKKAKDLSYRRYKTNSRETEASKNSRLSRQPGASRDMYHMEDVKRSANHKSTVVGSSQTSGSSENILPKEGIVKSVEYSVSVDKPHSEEQNTPWHPV